MSIASKSTSRCILALLLAAGVPPHAAHADGALLLAKIFEDDATTARLAPMLVPLLVRDSAVASQSLVSLKPMIVADSGDGEDQSYSEPESSGDGESESESESYSDKPRVIDPNFQQWQRHADEMLEAEKSKQPFEHPLTKDYPKDFITVCEAGCRDHKTDEIVSRVARPERKPRVERGFDPTSSAPASHDAHPADAAADDIDPGTIRCEAGCYGRVKSHRARLPRRADLDAPALGRRFMLAPQTASNGAIVGPVFAIVTAEAYEPSDAPLEPEPAAAAHFAIVRTTFDAGDDDRK